jgi:hypothetical protein
LFFVLLLELSHVVLAVCDWCLPQTLSPVQSTEAALQFLMAEARFLLHGLALLVLVFGSLESHTVASCLPYSGPDAPVHVFNFNHIIQIIKVCNLIAYMIQVLFG